MINAHQLEVKWTKDKSIFRPLDAYISQGELVVLLGKNGSGKSSFLKALAGLIPYQGSLTIQGTEIKELSDLVLASFRFLLFQNNPVNFPFLAEELVAAGQFREPDANNQLHKASEHLKAAGLHHLIGKPINQLSGGEQQLIWIEQMDFANVPLLLLDEPAHYLDWHYQSLLKARISTWIKSGKTVVLSTHQLEIIPEELIGAETSKLWAFEKSSEIASENAPSSILQRQLTKEHIHTTYQSIVNKR